MPQIELREDVLAVRRSCRTSAASDGPSAGGKIFAVGLYGAIWPGKAASTMKNEQQREPDERLLAAADRAPEVGADRPCRRLGDQRRRSRRAASASWSVAPTDGALIARSRVRGSRNAVATSAARIASSTATVISRKSACMSG